MRRAPATPRPTTRAETCVTPVPMASPKPVDTSFLVPGLVTGVGSLPHRDPKAAAAFVLATTPNLPAMPTLPNLDPAEGMIEHAIAGDTLESERAFLAAYRRGPVKAQLTGPVTPPAAGGDDDRALELFCRNAAALEQQLDGRPALCMLDEPSFGARSPLH